MHIISSVQVPPLPPPPLPPFLVGPIYTFIPEPSKTTFHEFGEVLSGWRVSFTNSLKACFIFHLSLTMSVYVCLLSCHNQELTYQRHCFDQSEYTERYIIISYNKVKTAVRGCSKPYRTHVTLQTTYF